MNYSQLPGTGLGTQIQNSGQTETDYDYKLQTLATNDGMPEPNFDVDWLQRLGVL